MNSVIADWARIGICSVGFILVLKLLFLRWNIPGVSQAVASI